jgi:nitroreductase
MDVFEAIANRRSIRSQKSDSFDDEALQKILEAGRWAPSWGNSQCWRFIVVRNPEIKYKLSETMLNIRRRDDAGPSPTALSVREAPVVIVVCAQLNKSGCRADGSHITDKGGSWYMFDTALATQNMCLEAHALGLGTVIIGGFDAVKANEILGVPEDFCVVTMTPVGFAAQEARPPSRKELSDIVFHDKFGT